MRWFSLVLIVGTLLWAFEERPRIVLKDGSSVAFTGKVSQEMNMLAIKTKKGKLLLSKDLVDWEATWYSAPLVVEHFKPDTARTVAAREAERAKKNAKKQIVITNKTLKTLKPGQGLVNARPVEPASTTVHTTSEEPAKPIIEVITRGERVTLADHMVPGRYVIFDFYADWCGPCRRMDPHLRKFIKKYPDRVALKKIDIVRWRSPVANQYDINSIPHLRVYNPSGKLVRTGGRTTLNYLKSLARREKW